MKFPTVSEFLASGASSAWCKEGPIKVYLRIEYEGAISITNMYSVAPTRAKNVLKREKFIRTGHFAWVMDKLEESLWASGYCELYFAAVCNEFLPDVLKRRGYVEVRDHLTPRYALYAHRAKLLRKSA